MRKTLQKYMLPVAVAATLTGAPQDYNSANAATIYNISAPTVTPLGGDTARIEWILSNDSDVLSSTNNLVDFEIPSLPEHVPGTLYFTEPGWSGSIDNLIATGEADLPFTEIIPGSSIGIGYNVSNYSNLTFEENQATLGSSGNGDFQVPIQSPTSVPEPTSALGVGLGLGYLALRRRRK